MPAEVRVIIPTYNYAAYLEKAISSLEHQSFQDFTVYIVDDGSTDNTRDIVQKYLLKQPAKYVYIYQANRGVAAARNGGLKNSKEKYIAFLDADDYWEPHTLSTMVAFMNSNEHFVMAYGNARVIDIRTGEDLGLYYGPTSYRRPVSGSCASALCRYDNFIASDAAIIRADVLREIGCFNEHLVSGEDLDMWIRIARKGDVGYMDMVLCNIRTHADSLSFISTKNIYALWKITKNILHHMPDIVREVGLPFIHKKMSRLYYGLATDQWAKKKYRRTRVLLLESFRLDSLILAKQKWIVYFLLSIPGLTFTFGVVNKLRKEKNQAGPRL